jgi:hypothetical protein
MCPKISEYQVILVVKPTWHHDPKVRGGREKPTLGSRFDFGHSDIEAVIRIAKRWPEEGPGYSIGGSREVKRSRSTFLQPVPIYCRSVRAEWPDDQA